jgi:hypothetical protein
MVTALIALGSRLRTPFAVVELITSIHKANSTLWVPKFRLRLIRLESARSEPKSLAEVLRR